MSDYLLSALCDKYLQERDSVSKELARVTAERDEAEERNCKGCLDALLARDGYLKDVEKLQANFDSQSDALRARVAEQYAKGYDDCKREYEEKLVSLSAITAEWRDGCNFQRERAEKTEQRNAELVAALRKLHRVMSAWLECYGHRTGDAACIGSKVEGKV